VIGVGTLVTVVVTVALLPVLIRELRRRVVMDAPVERSSHEIPTPRGGGLAPAIGAAAGLLMAVGTSESTLLTVVAVAAAFGVLGFVDDVSTLSAGRRLIVQIVIAAAGVFPLVSDAADGLMPVMLAAIGWLWLVAFVNAFNFMDGINGVSATQVAVSGIAWGLVGLWRDETVLTSGGLIVAAAALAFLPFNVPRARVFLGDVGSYFFGGWLAALALVALGRQATLEMAVAPLLLYVCDTGVTLVKRITHGGRWREAHREHVYQRLVIGGWSHSRTTAYVGAVIALSSLLGAATMLGNLAVRVTADAALILLMLGYLGSPTWQARRTRIVQQRPR